MDNDSIADYRQYVLALAHDVEAAVANGQVLEDALHEAVDGSRWVVYTALALKVLDYSGNSEAIMELGIGLDGSETVREAVVRAAYHALYHDVLGHLQRSTVWNRIDQLVEGLDGTTTEVES
jgi:hypothetical protein